MFPLGHLGVGARAVQSWTPPVQRRWVLLGALLPDLVDKPLYYALAWVTGRRGAAIGLVSGSRTFGHTALLLIIVWLASLVLSRRWIRFVALGMVTHLVLDELIDILNVATHLVETSILGSYDNPSTLWAIFFPLFGWRFPGIPFRNALDHVASLRNPYVLASEILGALLLYQHRRRMRRVQTTRAGV